MDILLFQLLIVSLLFASPECLQKCCTSGFWGFLVLFGFGFGLAWFGLDFFFGPLQICQDKILQNTVGKEWMSNSSEEIHKDT